MITYSEPTWNAGQRCVQRRVQIRSTSMDVNQMTITNSNPQKDTKNLSIPLMIIHQLAAMFVGIVL